LIFDRNYHCAHVIAVGVAAASYCHHLIEPHALVKRALADANKYAIKWNSGRDLMSSSKLPILSYQDTMETLEKTN